MRRLQGQITTAVDLLYHEVYHSSAARTSTVEVQISLTRITEKVLAILMQHLGPRSLPSGMLAAWFVLSRSLSRVDSEHVQRILEYCDGMRANRGNSSSYTTSWNPHFTSLITEILTFCTQFATFDTLWYPHTRWLPATLDCAPLGCSSSSVYHGSRVWVDPKNSACLLDLVIYNSRLCDLSQWVRVV